MTWKKPIEGQKMRVEFVVPFPPSVNRIWRHSKGVTYRSPKYMAWRQRAADATQGLWRGDPYLGRVSVEVRLYGPSRRRWDIDNRAKVVLDLIQHLEIVADDEQVDRLVLLRGPVTPGGGCHVIVEAMEPGRCPALPA